MILKDMKLYHHAVHVKMDIIEVEKIYVNLLILQIVHFYFFFQILEIIEQEMKVVENLMNIIIDVIQFVIIRNLFKSVIFMKKMLK